MARQSRFEWRHSDPDEKADQHTGPEKTDLGQMAVGSPSESAAVPIRSQVLRVSTGISCR